MISDGMYFKLIEDRDNVFNHIKELEIKRLEENPSDIHRLDCLYEVYGNICDKLNT
ncbi:MAG: hypothetical protein ACRCWM_07575 [Sarcina sp.]